MRLVSFHAFIDIDCCILFHFIVEVHFGLVGVGEFLVDFVDILEAGCVCGV